MLVVAVMRALLGKVEMCEYLTRDAIVSHPKRSVLNTKIPHMISLNAMCTHIHVFSLVLLAILVPRASGSPVVTNVYFDALPDSIADDVYEAMESLNMLTNDGNLMDDVSLQPFIEREAGASFEDTDALDILGSLLAVKWPSNETTQKISFVLYVPNGEAELHAMHVCGFLYPDRCKNEVPYAGKDVGKCGLSDASEAETGFFCDFVALHETKEEDGGVLMSGSEVLERYKNYVEAVEHEVSASTVEIHFELVEIGDHGIDEDDFDDALAPSPAPDSDTKSTRGRKLPVRGPAFGGLQMVTRAGPGRRSFVTLPGSLSGR